ncbi:electron transfer flavoprotein subunit beta/FixA family protein [Pelagibacterium halotolerans]|uniref:electron transfer flavoprotein subunit beta/FixA family protein n=1 Tax=Pelagibacterium halotolerans TaxID=531813 RepID=UPI00384D147E
MKILVAVKRVVDHTVRIRVRPDGSGVDTDNARFSINPFCKHAVEAAVQLAEHGHADEVVAVTIGPAKANDVLLVALAMGADRGIHLVTEARTEPLAVAKLLKAVVEEEKPDLVLLGKQAVDDDANQTGQMLAGLLDWPQATFASGIEVDHNGLKITREVDYGRATYALKTPAIVTADLRLNEPRNTALPQVMKAKKKPVDTRPAADLGIDIAPRLTVEKVSPPPERTGGQAVGSVAELVDIIAETATAGERT